jgi:AraC-like DNA-binding protein
MTQTRVRSAPVASQTLLERIRYDVSLEETALRRLSELDVSGCRAALGKLVSTLDLGGHEGARSQVPLLLLDVLQRVNRRLFSSSVDRAVFQDNRVRLIGRFASLRDGDSARREFLPELNRLLAVLDSGSVNSNRLVARARTYIEENYQRRISLSSIAERLNVSPNYLSRQFRKEAGDTLTAYIQRIRLQHALLLLAEGGRSISEIAYLVGYQNYRDFYRNFVKYENASPREVKRRLALES